MQHRAAEQKKTQTQQQKNPNPTKVKNQNPQNKPTKNPQNHQKTKLHEDVTRSVISVSLWDTAHRDTRGKLHRKLYFYHCFKCLAVILFLFILVNSEDRGLHHRISLLYIWTHLVHYSSKFIRAL